MKKYIYVLGALLFTVTVMMSTGCQKGYGCHNANTQVQTDRKGNMSMKRGKSQLFPKKMRKN